MISSLEDRSQEHRKHDGERCIDRGVEDKQEVGGDLRDSDAALSVGWAELRVRRYDAPDEEGAEGYDNEDSAA